MNVVFADILLPLYVPSAYTYIVPENLVGSVVVGQRVVVPFGNKKKYSGLVLKLHNTKPATENVKEILYVLDDYPLVYDIQFRFWEWIAKYYMCYLGEVMQAALPAALKLASETQITINPFFDGDLTELSNKELQIINHLEAKQILNLTEIAEILNQQHIFPYIQHLLQLGIVVITEEIKNQYKPKIEQVVFLNAIYHSEEKKAQLFDQLQKKAEKQRELLQRYFILTKFDKENSTGVSKNELIDKNDAYSRALKAMLKKNIFELKEREILRIASNKNTISELPLLSEHQKNAYSEIKNALAEKDVVLLHGITSSGKTEVYCHLIQETIDQDKQVLFLLPEIALTSQLINRLRKYFGDKVGVYHSRFNPNERVEVWNRLLNPNQLHKTNKYQIILGARSAVFLPFSNLGLVIVDEEHDSSYKQKEPAPRYQARDAAIYLAKLHGAKVILGSATPSFESYYNAVTKRYQLVELQQRYGGYKLPQFNIIDTKAHSKKGMMKSHFSPEILNAIKQALSNKKQVLLFQNRRGFSTRLECDNCQYIPQCKNCDVTLIYHKSANLLKCHYCGYSIAVPANCPACNHSVMLMKGFGTEKIEDELPIFFPEAKIGRMDLDTTRSKNAYITILNDFEDRNIDILVGTQMITKGLDFDNIEVVGILNADSMINFPDFRAWERSFQLLSQVSGRAGRKTKNSQVFIQTHMPKHAIFQHVINGSYTLFFEEQMQERERYLYPPFYRLILIHVKHKNFEIINQAASLLAKNLKEKMGRRVLGPEFPVISRIKNEYIKNILIKVEKQASVSEIKAIIQAFSNQLRKENDYKSVKVLIDVDPDSIL